MNKNLIFSTPKNFHCWTVNWDKRNLGNIRININADELHIQNQGLSLHI